MWCATECNIWNSGSQRPWSLRDLWLNAFLFLYQQVLLSIQGMMFTPDPCFNEPGYEGIKGTDEGDVSSILLKIFPKKTRCILLCWQQTATQIVWQRTDTVKICLKGLNSAFTLIIVAVNCIETPIYGHKRATKIWPYQSGSFNKITTDWAFVCARIKWP